MRRLVLLLSVTAGLLVPGCKDMKSSASDTNKISASESLGAPSVTIVEKERFAKYDIRLGNKTILTIDSTNPKDKHAEAPKPSIYKSFGAIGGFDEVVLLRWEMDGNACNGYGYSFLSLKKDGTFSFSDNIPWCGGPDPVLTTSGQSITITSPKHAPNRGTGDIPEERWVYENGNVKKTK